MAHNIEQTAPLEVINRTIASMARKNGVEATIIEDVCLEFFKQNENYILAAAMFANKQESDYLLSKHKEALQEHHDETAFLSEEDTWNALNV